MYEEASEHRKTAVPIISSSLAILPKGTFDE